MKEKMSELWEPTLIEMDAVNWKQEPIHLKNVPAVKDRKTGKVLVDPEAVAKAELEQLAQKYGLEPRELPMLLMLYAKPRIAKSGDIEYRYHLNKMLFYQWKNLEKEGLGEAFPHDKFIAKRRGPVPEHGNEDLDKLEKSGLISCELVKWGKGSLDESRKIRLTDKGRELSEKLWQEVPGPLQAETVQSKGRIFALDPMKVRELVHKEFPEYRSTYEEEDRS